MKHNLRYVCSPAPTCYSFIVDGSVVLMEQELNLIEFGQNIKKYRGKKITQELLAEEIGITTKHLSEIENAKTCPSIEVVYKIAQALGHSVSTLIGDQVIEKNIGVMTDEEFIELYASASNIDKLRIKTISRSILARSEAEILNILP